MRRSSALLALVPLLGLAELGLHQYFAARAPGPDEYAALGRELSKLKQPRTPVVIAPAWAEPLLRAAAPAAFPLAELARPDDSAFAAFWEVSALGESAPELAGFSREQTRKVGAFSLSLRKNPHPQPTLFNFVSAVEAGQVEVFTELEGARMPCPLNPRARVETGGLHGHVAYPARRFECQRERFVGVSLVEDRDYRPRRCVLSRLPTSGSLVLRFNGVPRAPRLVGFAGFSWFLERDAQAPQVELTVRGAERELGRRLVAGADGWSRFELGAAEADVVEVSLRRLAASQSDVCFALEAR